MAAWLKSIGAASPRAPFECMSYGVEMKPNTQAFSLLELIVALAIAAALAAFAIPSYRTHIAKAHRTDAASALYRAAQFAESAVHADGAPLPSGIDQAPQGGRVIYRLRILPADDTNGGYALEAQPLENGPMAEDACGTFILDATGLKTNRGAADVAPDGCWSAR
jgi:type IV pilus assembly protein PilE